MLNVAPNLAKHSQLLHCTVRFKSQVNVFGGDSQRIGKMVVLSLDDIELKVVVLVPFREVLVPFLRWSEPSSR